jgi:hypothetical protein
MEHLSPLSTSVQSNLEVVNLDGNELHDWALICEKFKSYSTYVPNCVHMTQIYESVTQRRTSYFNFEPNRGSPVHCRWLRGCTKHQTLGVIFQQNSSMVRHPCAISMVSDAGDTQPEREPLSRRCGSMLPPMGHHLMSYRPEIGAIRAAVCSWQNINANSVRCGACAFMCSLNERLCSDITICTARVRI